MITLGGRIKQLRTEAHLTGEEFGELFGVAKSTVSLYENNKSTPDDEIKIKMCKYFNISLDYLMGLSNNRYNKKEPQKGIKIPILGSVVAGIPVEAITDIIGYEEITPQMAKNGNYFALKVRGESMLPELKNGDIVIIREQPDVESGEIAIVLVNGDEATVKQVKKLDYGIMLYGFNSAVYAPHYYDSKDIEELPVTIIGKVVESRRCW
ncbi:LexA family transcriptional regulator [Megasphaera cerevisiae DSM 20462]|uniref:LexA family transcriptional regulator n=1 Tax=Megasphaera cerevisiae DSM 20462 TaxID=1122219 RepID=A0A0J6WV69_9FIRM|nr:XRE family transcriptional regulator [Megasphaera cerevisiae]KMO85692.1 LexA family transcriptional regulator [Megasphaera cerevisiae DSM 20462]SKA11161.1 repressor LexA [Megasphaera cerevisiae DSM 20462]